MTGTATAAVRAVARSRLRHRWRGLLALAVVLGLAGGAALAVATLAVRTTTAYPRLVEATALDDARVLVPADQPELVAALPGLPGVVGFRRDVGWIAQVEGPGVRLFSVSGPDPDAARYGEVVAVEPGLARPVVVAGRAPDPRALDEVLLGEPFAAQSGLGVGAELAFRLRTPDELANLDTAYAPPSQPVVRARVVGVGRLPAWGGMQPEVLTTSTFAQVNRQVAGTYPTFVRLADGAGPAFTGAYAAAAATQPESRLARYLPPIVEHPRTEGDPSTTASERALRSGFVTVLVALGVGAPLVVGQGLLRRAGADRAAQEVEAALGMTAAERVAARVLAACPGALVVAVLAAAAAVASGLLEPLGSQARFEPAPGFRPQWLLAWGGAAAVAALYLLLAGVAAAWAGRPGDGPARRTPLRSRPVRSSPAVAVGIGMAGRGAGRLAAVAGAAAVFAGTVAAVTVGASVDRVVHDPVRHGQAADLVVVDFREPDLPGLTSDPRITGVDTARTSGIELADGTRVETTARQHRLGAVPDGITEGRVPERLGEIALGPRFAARLGLGVGDVVVARRPNGATVDLLVTGIVVAPRGNPNDQRGSLGELAQTTGPQLRALATSVPLSTAYITTAPGTADAVREGLQETLEVFGREAPPAVRNLADLGQLPALLALLLAAVGAAGLAHTLLVAVRRGATGLGVLAALGVPPARLLVAPVVTALVVAVPVVVVGTPAGLGLARILWWQVATSTGVAGDVAVPVGLLLWLGPLTVVGAVAAAAGAGARVLRTPPATVLGNAP